MKKRKKKSAKNITKKSTKIKKREKANVHVSKYRQMKTAPHKHQRMEKSLLSPLTNLSAQMKSKQIQCHITEQCLDSNISKRDRSIFVQISCTRQICRIVRGNRKFLSDF